MADDEQKTDGQQEPTNEGNWWTRLWKRKSGDDKEKESVAFEVGVAIAAIIWTSAVVVAVNFYTGGDQPKDSICLLAAFAASAVGGLVGFLFGVPKGPSDSDGQQRFGFYYRPNTNLEQVSDWLTKIIVGVGLVQFREIGNAIYDMGRGVGAAVGDIQGLPGSGTVFAIALMSATGVVTFLLAYMWTTTALYKVYEATHRRPRRAASLRLGQPSRRR